MNDESKNKLPDLAESTLGEYGYSLPVGVLEGNPPQLGKGFSFKPYRTKDEQAIEKLRKKQQHPGWDVVTVLSQMLRTWGSDNDFAGKADKIKRSAINSAFMCDVLYAYINLRVEAMGEIIALDQECPSCATKWQWKADLNDMTLTVADGIESLEQTYKLRHPIEMGEKVYDTLVVGPPTWAAVTSIKTASRKSGVADIKMNMIVHAIRAMLDSSKPDQRPIPAAPSLLGEMSKYDLERLSATVDRLFPNVDVALEIDCPHCGHNWKYPVQWGFDFFFGGSSLPLEM